MGSLQVKAEVKLLIVRSQNTVPGFSANYNAPAMLQGKQLSVSKKLEVSSRAVYAPSCESSLDPATSVKSTFLLKLLEDSRLPD